MQVVILAGGAGTRLQPIVSDRPKPMAGFSERPFLQYQLEALRRQGLRDFVLCVGYMHEHILDYFGDGRRWDVQIRYSVESSPLGTAGALRHASSLLEDSFLLLNGDSFLEMDVADFVAFHRRRRQEPATLGTLALVHMDDARAYGSVEFDKNQQVQAFREKERSGPAWISAGFYALEAGILALEPSEGPQSLERDLLPAALQASGLQAYLAQGFFVDIGTPSGHETFRHYVEGMPS
jgi:NDP-sugar pyrophosphorylase family protein